MVRSLVLAAALLLPSAATLAQSQSSIASTWDVFAGVSVLRSGYPGLPGGYTVSNATVQLPYPVGTPQYSYGWAFSLTQRLDAHPWVGGGIEGSGFYSSSNWLIIPTNGQASFTEKNSANTYTAMAGPVVQAPHGKIRPFAHAMFGAVVTSTFLNNQGQTGSSIVSDYFGSALGGGADYRLGRHAGVRVQADYLRVWSQNTITPNNLRLFGGIVLH